MTQISDTQEFARHFNEDEAIWRRFQEQRLARQLLEADSSLPESILDHLDWLKAEREDRTTHAVAQTNRLSLPVTEPGAVATGLTYATYNHGSRLTAHCSLLTASQTLRLRLETATRMWFFGHELNHEID